MTLLITLTSRPVNPEVDATGETFSWLRVVLASLGRGNPPELLVTRGRFLVASSLCPASVAVGAGVSSGRGRFSPVESSSPIDY